jgi:hypothetical protein
MRVNLHEGLDSALMLLQGPFSANLLNGLQFK